ncbi:MAG: NTP transferase domain-containing protein [Candidatus Liptonbacteria bacterium]|nr:NTP transferase domain-containing protein [Candidatus Liptonbacteria bacterium]
MNQNFLKNIDAVVLCGGLGTRLQGILPGRQKVVMKVGSQPFLGTLLDRIFSQGVGRAVLCVGHLKEQVIDYILHKKIKHSEWGEIVFSEEEKPLGTGGAIKNAESKITSDHFFVMNGDSWIEGGIDLHKLHDFHKKKNTLATVVLARPRKEKDYGAVFLKEDGKIGGFNEKANENRTHFMNAGVYLMEKKSFELMPEGPFSLENDFFPKLVGGAMYGFPVEGELIDIGTPERYRLANKKYA